MTDWPSTAANLVTGAGTLVLAADTFASVRSAERSARTAERALAVGVRPVLFPSRPGDPEEKVAFIDQRWLHLPGGRASIEVHDGMVYMGFTVRNVGQGIAVLHSWQVWPRTLFADDGWPDVAGYRRLTRDLYVPAGGTGFWQGAIRDAADPVHGPLLEALSREGQPITVEVVYTDHEGHQPQAARFVLARVGESGVWHLSVGRHRSLDRSGPREGWDPTAP